MISHSNGRTNTRTRERTREEFLKEQHEVRRMTIVVVFLTSNESIMRLTNPAMSLAAGIVVNKQRHIIVNHERYLIRAQPSEGIRGILTPEKALIGSTNYCNTKKDWYPSSAPMIETLKQ
jgi:hypothetical protein